MNIQEHEILMILAQDRYRSQRALAQDSGYAIGTVNQSLQSLIAKGYLNEYQELTPKAQQLLSEKQPRSAIILAAGYGLRMVPINTETPKGLLEVNGEPLIERLIRQLQEVGVRKIYVVVGFMKEQYEYLMDTYGVELIVNREYGSKNNLHSLKRVAGYLDDAYIVPCDLWCRSNPFRRYELYSWYMVSTAQDPDSTVRANRKKELVSVSGSMCGNRMVGISYLTRSQAGAVRERLGQLSRDRRYDDAFWEEALYAGDKMITAARIVDDPSVVEINTYEQLRELDHESAQLHTRSIFTVAKAMGVSVDAITNIEALKKGMTNRSFLFSCQGEKYIMRIPGEGTGKLINREQEAAVYRRLGDRDICDDIIYIDPKSGYKITRYFEGTRVCDPLVEADLRRCMEKLRSFHRLGLQVGHTFDIFGQIEFYESLWNGHPSVYRDYARTKEKILSLRSYIEQHAEPYVLTHIDAVPDNFLFVSGGDGAEQIRLIDWEYAGMQDPHVDIAMFCIYALYDRQQVDHLIDLYFENACSREKRIKIYCYIACCGLLWSNWCEYKQQLGVEFGEYSLRQYRYAKDYYRIVQEERKGGI